MRERTTSMKLAKWLAQKCLGSMLETQLVQMLLVHELVHLRLDS